MKTKLLFLISFVFVLFRMQGQIPGNSCSTPPILQVDTEYTINNLDTSQYGFISPIQGHCSGSNNVIGFWLRVEIPSGYYATQIRIYDVSSNFDPVIGLKSHCTYSYYPNTNNNHDYADDNGMGGDEIFGTGLTGPDSNNDGIYHIRIYHYVGSKTPTVSFKIKITDGSSQPNYDLSISNESISNSNPNIGDQIHLSCHQNYSGNCSCNHVSPNPKVGYFLSTNQDYESSNDTLLGTSSSSIGDNDPYDPENLDWTIPSSVTTGNYYILFVADYDNQHSETNESNNTEYVPITINGSSCTGVTITQQPTNQTVTSGNSATFSVTATGTAPITYQWTKNGYNISGATNSTYTTPTLYTSDNGNTYMCKVTNCDGTVNSNIASVTVNN